MTRDAQIKDVRRKIRSIRGGIKEMYGFIYGLPGKQRGEARAALQKAFEVGIAYGQLQQLPIRPPMDNGGYLQVGPALRQHILETRKVYGQINMLREIVADIFDRKSAELLSKIIQDVDGQTDTRMGEVHINR